ncbi:MAG: IPT/TIG domain-containing protein [Bryobacteraceae bacterium]
MTKPFGKLCWISLMAASQVALAQQYSITTVAGGAPPPTPAAAASTTIGQPNRVMVDASGNVYFSSLNCVFKMDGGGNLTLMAGNSRPGFSGDGGPATQAQLNAPQGLALDQNGNLYIADSKNNRIRIVSSTGIINTFAGTGQISPGGASTYNDGGLATNALLHLPAGVAVDKSGNVYIADTGDNLIREVTTDGLINSIAGDSYGSYRGDAGPALAAELHSPEDVAVDSSGNVYIADSANAVIREITASTGIINYIAGNVTAPTSGAVTGTPNVGYSGDGAAANLAGLVEPFALALDSSGEVYFAENGDSRIRKIDTKGNISTIAGNGTAGYSGDGSTGTNAELNFPTGVAVDSSGNVYIADLVNLRIRKLTSGGTISTVAGNGKYSYSGDGGQATSAQLNTPQAVAADSSGNLYIADTVNNVVRKVTAAGVISTIAGNGTAGSGGDGGAATSAQLHSPQGIAVDANGGIYIADTQNARVRKITNGTINTVAGSGTAGFGGDSGAATSAQLNIPAGLAVDGAGNLYIADFSNNRVRKVTPGGTITTLAGNGLEGYSGDGGPATGAQLATPVGLATDSSGNVYIADTGNNAVRVVNSSGIVSTVAGNGLAGYSGDGGPAVSAMVGNPSGVALDASGNLYISDGSVRVRKVYSSGFINTIAGNGTRGYSGDGGVGPFATMSGPAGIALASNGNLYIADSGNSAVRELLLGGFQIKIAAVANAASNLAGPVAGGEIAVLYGSGMGPAGLVQYTPGTNGQLPTSLAGTTVYFGNYAAPLLYASANQISAIVPYEVSGSQAQVFVKYNGDLSATFPVSLATAAPALFTADASGKGQAAAINIQNGAYAYNNAAHPLNAGDYVELFLTGTGQTNPPSVDGQLTPDANELVAANVTVTIGGRTFTPVYAGGAPGIVAGLTQVNAQIPSGLTAGAVPVSVQVGSVVTQPGVTIAVSGK